MPSRSSFNKLPNHYRRLTPAIKHAENRVNRRVLKLSASATPEKLLAARQRVDEAVKTVGALKDDQRRTRDTLFNDGYSGTQLISMSVPPPTPAEVASAQAQVKEAVRAGNHLYSNWQAIASTTEPVRTNNPYRDMSGQSLAPGGHSYVPSPAMGQSGTSVRANPADITHDRWSP
jgi:hypothetical protein